MGQGGGKSWAGSAKCVIGHAKYPGSNSLVVAPTYQNNRQITLPAIVERLTEAGVYHRVNLATMEIQTPTLGSRILFHSGLNAERITGFEVGRVWIDEPARIPDFGPTSRNVWNNCVARCRSQLVPDGLHQVFITGTHEGAGTWVYKLWESKNRDAAYAVYRGATTENPTALEYAKQLLELYGPDLAEQYVQGGCLEESNSAIPYEDIIGCQHELARRKPLWNKLRESRNKFYAGMDIGRSKSLTVVWMLERIGPMFVTCGVVEMEKAPFAEQAAMIDEVLAIPNVVRMTIDSTYNPQLAEDAVTKYGDYRVNALRFDQETKIRLAENLRRRAIGRTIAIPKGDDIVMDWYSVKRVVSRNGTVTYSAPYTNDGHADRFWAAAMSVYGAAESFAPPWVKNRADDDWDEDELRSKELKSRRAQLRMI